jgi:flagellar protein FliO/FliZ
MTTLKWFLGGDDKPSGGLKLLHYVKPRVARLTNATVALYILSDTVAAGGEAQRQSAALEPSGSLFMTELGVAVLIAACAWVALSIWRKRGGRGAGGMAGDALKVVSGVMVGQRERVVVLRARNRFFLLGVTPQNISLLAEFDSATETEAWLAAQAATKDTHRSVLETSED